MVEVPSSNLGSPTKLKSRLQAGFLFGSSIRISLNSTLEINLKSAWVDIWYIGSIIKGRRSFRCTLDIQFGPELNVDRSFGLLSGEEGSASLIAELSRVMVLPFAEGVLHMLQAATILHTVLRQNPACHECPSLCCHVL